MELFTSQMRSNGINSQSECFQGYGDSHSEDLVLKQTDIESIDAQLVNLPNDVYIGNLIEICAYESTMSWYCNVLSSRANPNLIVLQVIY